MKERGLQLPVAVPGVYARVSGGRHHRPADEQHRDQRPTAIRRLHSVIEPEALRIELSRGLGAIREARASQTRNNAQDARGLRSLADELGKLASMLDSGLLTRDEFDHLKATIIAGS